MNKNNNKKNQKPNLFAQRRSRFLKQLGDGFALIFTAPHYIRNNDSHFEFRPDSYFYYLTGFEEPEAAAILIPQGQNPFTLYVAPKDPSKELWTGIRAGTKGAVSSFGADQSFPFATWQEHVDQLMRKMHKMYYGMGTHKPYDDKIAALLSAYQPNMRGGERPLASIVNPLLILNEMRLFKDEDEIALMQQAADIAKQAYRDVIKTIPTLKHEYEVEALMEYHFRRLGATAPSFASIVGCGDNATVLHYDTNRDPLKKGELVLIDTGCEYQYYASDVTRTVPVNGKFTEPQREIYEVVLRAQKECIKMAKPGVRCAELQRAAQEHLCRGLMQLNIVKGNLNEAIKSKEFLTYYPHRIGHWLGMDVHDVGDYFEADGMSRRLEPGMVMTIEPGLYFSRNDKTVPPAYRGIGIRIEDNILITKSGNRVLTDGIPKEIAEIESLMRG